MRVLLLTPLFPPDEGGAAQDFNYLSQIFNSYAKVSDIMVLSNWRGAKKLHKTKGKINHFRVLNYGKNRHPLSRLIWNVMVINEMIERFEPDMIVFHSTVLPYREYFRQLLRGLSHIKIYLFKTDLLPVEDFPGLTGICYISRNVFDLCVRDLNIPGEKMIYTPLLFKPPRETGKMKTIPFKFILFAGWVVPSKGAYELIKAFEILQKKFENLKLVLIGSSFAGASYHPGVIFLKEMGRSRLISYIKNAEVVVIPSFSEAFSRVGLEAVYFKRPLVISASIPEWRYLPCTQLLERITPEEIKEKIENILNGAPYNTNFPGEYQSFTLARKPWDDLIEKGLSEITPKPRFDPSRLIRFIHEFHRANRKSNRETAKSNPFLLMNRKTELYSRKILELGNSREIPGDLQNHLPNMDIIKSLYLERTLNEENWRQSLEAVENSRFLMDGEKKELLKVLLMKLAAKFNIFAPFEKVRQMFRPLIPHTSADMFFLGDYAFKQGEAANAKTFFLKGLELHPEIDHFKIFCFLFQYMEIYLDEVEKKELELRFCRLLEQIDFIDLVNVLDDVNMPLVGRYVNIGKKLADGLDDKQLKNLLTIDARYKILNLLASYKKGNSSEQKNDYIWRWVERLSAKKRTPLERYRLASLYKTLNKSKSALREFGKIINRTIDAGLLSGAYLHIGEIHLTQNRRMEALNNFKKCLELNPFNNKAGGYLRDMGEGGKKDPEVDAVIEEYKRDFSYKKLYDAASLLRNRGKNAQAGRLWEFLLKHPDKTNPHYIGAACLKLGELAKEAGDNETAEGFFKECLKLIPNHIKALNYTGAFSKIVKDWEKLKQEVTTIIAGDRNIRDLPPGTAQIPAKQEFKPTVSTGKEKFPYRVTAIISTYNAEAYMRGCLEDLESQTIAHQLEIIVVNSGSTQNEEAIVRSFQEKYANVVYIRTGERETIYKAWNRAIKIARGKYITNANTDDRHRSDAFEIMAGYLDKHPEAAAVYARQYIVDKPNRIFEKAHSHVIGQLDWPEFNREILMEYSCVGPQPMWRASLHKDHGYYFDEGLEVSGDYDFWLRVSQHFTLKLIPRYLGIYYRAPDRSNKEWQDRYIKLNEQYRVQRENYWNMLHTEAFKPGIPGQKSQNTLNEIDVLLADFKEREEHMKRRFEYLSWSLAVRMEYIKQLDLSKRIAQWALRLIGSSNRLSRHIRHLNLLEPLRTVSGKHRVSIIIPYFNNQSTVRETLASISNQTYNTIEVLIVDNGSTASSLEQLKEIVKEFPHLEIILMKKKGQGNDPRRNIAVEKAKGEFILALDADDQIGTAYIEKTLGEFEKDRTLDVVYTETIVYGFINELWVTDDFSGPGIYTRNQLNVTALIKKKSFLRVGGYREELPGYEDWDLWIRMAKLRMKLKRIPEPLFFYRKIQTSRGFQSQHRDLEKRLALIKANPEIYRLPEAPEMPILEQNPHFIPPLFLKDNIKRPHAIPEK